MSEQQAMRWPTPFAAETRWRRVLDALRTLVDHAAVTRKEVAYNGGTKRQTLDDALAETAGKSPRLRWLLVALEMADQHEGARSLARQVVGELADTIGCELRERPRMTADERARRLEEAIKRELGDGPTAARIIASADGRQP